jgi:hypothetical protein
MTKISLKKLRKPIFFCLIYLAVNLFLCAIVNKETSIIRYHENGAAMDEFAGKAIVDIASGFLFLAGVISSLAACRDSDLRPFFLVASALASLALVFLARPSVIEACSDHAGYCQNWRIHAPQK